MNVYWHGQTEPDVPPENDWLSTGEQTRLHAFGFPKRRADWRLGRWTAKRAVAFYLGLPPERPSLSRIEIISAPSGTPEVCIDHTPAPVTISLSHRDGRAACAVAQAGIQLGCDLETIEPRTAAFIADYLTEAEQKLIAHASATDRARLATLLWSAKESTLKALREGLRMDTRKVEVALDSSSVQNGWSALRVTGPDGQIFDGWWQGSEDILRTLVANPPPEPPIFSGT